MRILHLTKYLPPFTGGIEQVTDQFVRAGRQAGYETIVVGIASPATPAAEGIVPIDRFLQIGPAPLTLGYQRFMSQVQPGDLVHVHMPNPSAELAALISVAKRQAICVPVFHASILRAYPINKLWEHLQHRLLSASDAFIASSPDLVEHTPLLQKHRHKRIVLPFPTEPSATRSLEESARPTIFAVGRHVKYKGFDVLLEAMQDLDATLLLAGEGPATPQLRQLASRLGLEQRVKFLGRISDADKLTHMAQATAVAVPSRTSAEAYGMVIAEAISQGAVIVATDLPTGVRFLMGGGEAGALVQPDHVASLREALSRLLASPADREAARSRNRQFFREHLQFAAFQAAYGRVLRQFDPPGQRSAG